MKVLVIGCGSIGAQRARILVRKLRVNVALCDTNVERCGELARELLIDDVYIRPDIAAQSIGDLDAVLICTPPSSHLALAQQCAAAGIRQLFIEKPLAPTLDLSAIQQLAGTMSERGAWGLMGQSYRFLQSLREFRARYIDKPILSAEIWQGQHLADWHPGTDYKQGYAAIPGEGGVVLDSLAHSLDLVQWLFGKIGALTGLIGASGELGIPTDDVATLLVRMQSGAQVTVHNDYWQRPRGFHISVVCVPPPQPSPVTTGEGAGANTFCWAFDPAEADEMYLREMEHLVRCIERGYQGQPDLFQGILNLEWMDAARRASATGTWQRIGDEWAKLAGRK